MLLNNFEAILFDCDGTLVDTEYVNAQSIVETLKMNNWGEVTIDYVLEHWTGHSTAFILTALQEKICRDIPDNFFDFTIDIGIKLLPTMMRPIDDVLPFVKTLHEMKKPIAVGSNGSKPSVFASLEAGGFRPYFPDRLICTRHDVKWGKPAPELYFLAAERLGVDVTKCLIIEDSPTGTEAGIAAGATVWGFIGMAHDKKKVRASVEAEGAHRIFESYKDIADALGVQLQKQAA